MKTIFYVCFVVSACFFLKCTIFFFQINASCLIVCQLVLCSWSLYYLLFAFLTHPIRLSPFRLKCGINKNIPDSLNTPKLCDLFDEHLNNFLKKWISIKPDGYCLPQAVFNSPKENDFWLDIQAINKCFIRLFSTLLVMIYI